ncbi:penicillin-binding protein [Purpureocillium lilacinum]|uniref:Penicillin-binding protein n=1 Tax=Purpureocillium lilacinum TaxID=33203 RepID=A0A179GKV6_PURLI|nr:penicillin-binding protein [Purpureocillium lilacinum]OAQ77943.1 penicillin-binding protein [Purpureocillium lilacinum]
MLSHMYPLAILAASASATAVFDQKLLGPAYPAPSNLAAASAIREAAASISSALKSALDSGHSPFGNFTGKATSLSLEAVSAIDDGSSPILDFHYTAAELNTSAGSTSRVAADTVYRIGSVSKLFTVYALLLHGGAQYWDRPVTDFVPELRRAAALPGADDAVERVQWRDVTVGALASQLSGIGRDYNNADLASQGFPWKEAGLPPLPPSEIPTCAGNSSQPPCNRKGTFTCFIKRHPVLPPFTAPVYSNAAYRILGYVVEAIAGSPYDAVLARSVLRPLGLKKTSTASPSGSGVGVIPPGDSGWGRPLGDEVSTGGLYSSSHDLAVFGRALLTSKQLSRLATRHWMKPHSHTASPSASVGAPWEMARTRSRVTSGYAVDLYTKSGSDGQYNALLVLVPEFQVVVSLLAAGPDSGPVVTAAAETVLQALLPALDGVSQSQACDKFCGRYATADAAVNSSLVLAVDYEGPGLLVTQWISNGVDVRQVAQAYADATKGGVIESIRLYPTGLYAPGKAAFRAVLQTVPSDFNSSIPRILDPRASQWSAMDQLMYGEVAVDDFVFRLDGHGRAVAVEPRVLRQTLQRVGGK